MAAEALAPLYNPVESQELPAGFKHEPWCPMYMKFPSTKVWAHIQTKPDDKAPVSTYKHDYPVYKGKNKPNIIYPSHNLELAGVGFTKTSGYMDNYIKFKGEKSTPVRPKDNLAFDGSQYFSSLYRDQFCLKEPIPADKLPNRAPWKKPPRFSDTTTNADHYRHYSDVEASDARRMLIKPPCNIGLLTSLGPTRSTAHDSYVHHKGQSRVPPVLPKNNQLALDGPIDGTTTYYVNYCLPDRFKNAELPGFEPGVLAPENMREVVKPFCTCKKHLFNVGVQRVDMPKPENTSSFFQKYGKMSDSTENKENFCNSATEMPTRPRPEDNAEFFRLGGKISKQTSYRANTTVGRSDSQDWTALRQKKDISRASMSRTNAAPSRSRLATGRKSSTMSRTNVAPSYSNLVSPRRSEAVLAYPPRPVNPSPSYCRAAPQPRSSKYDIRGGSPMGAIPAGPYRPKLPKAPAESTTDLNEEMYSSRTSLPSPFLKQRA